MPSMSLSYDGNYLAYVVEKDALSEQPLMVKILDMKTRQETARLTLDNGFTANVSFANTNNQLLISCSGFPKDTNFIYDLKEKKTIRSVACIHDHEVFAFSPDDSLIVAGGYGFLVFSTHSCEPVLSPKSIQKACLMPALIL